MILFHLISCVSTTSFVYDVCDLQLEPAADTVTPGDLLVLTGSPQSDLRDTRVLLDGTSVEVISLDRTSAECGLCATCRSAATCDTCDTCAECTSTCDACVEELTVRIPVGSRPGTSSLTIVNGFGTGSASIVIAGATENTADTATEP